MTNNNKNMDALLPFSNGCQCIAMKLQFYDNNLASYYNFFKSVNSIDLVNGAYPLSPYALKAPSKRKNNTGCKSYNTRYRIKKARLPRHLIIYNKVLIYNNFIILLLYINNNI